MAGRGWAIKARGWAIKARGRAGGVPGVDDVPGHYPPPPHPGGKTGGISGIGIGHIPQTFKRHARNIFSFLHRGVAEKEGGIFFGLYAKK